MPNLKDHDFPVPNYLLSVSGYMFLEQKEQESDEDPGAESATYDISTAALEIRSERVKTTEEAENFWEVLIEQLRTQSNLTVTEKD